MNDEHEPRMEPADARAGEAGRRAVLCCAALGGAAALGGCGMLPDKGGEPADLTGKEIAKAADVPVGGGRAYARLKVVVTQPTAGAYRAFSALCTHAGCTVDRVSGGRITCPCHGSQFAIADGAVARGPASRPLKEYEVRLQGDGIVVV